MTPEAQRLAIAEFFGRKPNAYYCSICRECVPIETVMSAGIHSQCGGKVERDLPEYLDDLNLMHEAEKALDGDIDDPNSLRYRYAYLIYRLLSPEQQPFRATAAQRAEAFLRAIGKWP